MIIFFVQSPKGDLSSYQEKLAKVSAQKADLEVQLAENQEKLAMEERMKASAGDEKRVMDREIGNVKQDLADVQAKVDKANQEKNKLGKNYPGFFIYTSQIILIFYLNQSHSY